MLSKNIQKALNEQVRIEAESSQVYLAMAGWAEMKGYEGIAKFMYAQSDEERLHMLKLIKFMHERDAEVEITALKAPNNKFESFREMFQTLYKHELFVSESINKLVGLCLDEKDYSTHNFLQWYVSEQLEEEAQAKTILDKINIIGDDKGGLYLFDRDIQQLTVTTQAGPN